MKKLENILDMLDCGIVEIMFDGDARSITWANNGFFALTGASREEYDNELKHGNPKNVLHPDDFERVFSAFHKHVQTKETLSIEYRVIHKNGSYVWLSVVSNFIGYKNNKPCFINIMKDITELKKIRSKIEYEAERYRIICSLANDLLFEYDIENDTLISYSKNSYDFNTLRIDNFLSRPADHKMLPDDSIKVLRKFFLQEVVVARQYKKSEPFQMSYADQGSLYIARGYGKQPTSGYSVTVTRLYETENSICISTDLLGPEKGEETKEAATYPYVVVRLDYVEKDIIFD